MVCICVYVLRDMRSPRVRCALVVTVRGSGRLPYCFVGDATAWCSDTLVGAQWQSTPVNYIVCIDPTLISCSGTSNYILYV